MSEPLHTDKESNATLVRRLREGAETVHGTYADLAYRLLREAADALETRSAGVSSLPVTQCLTAGVSNSVTAGERLVCAECGCGNFIQMRLFPYDFHTEADYPEEHPDRCRKLDDTFYEPPIMEDGKSRPHWRCYKKVGHDRTNGGRHCSTHRDCGARIEGSGRCGLEPGHDNGIHEGDGPYTSTRSATTLLNARRYEWLRSHDKYEYPAMLGFAQVLIFQPTDEFLTDQYKRLSGVALDEAIDAQLNASDSRGVQK